MICAGYRSCVYAATLWLLLVPVSFGAEIDGKGIVPHKTIELKSALAGKSLFSLVPSDITGIRFTNRLSELSLARNRVLGNGSGVAIGDFDLDGLPDLFIAGLEVQSTLYRNQGNWRFADVTSAMGLPELRYSSGVTFADVNGDAYPDLFVASHVYGLRLFLNQGGKSFSEALYGLATNRGVTTVALADIDGNGTLDLYTANYRTNDIRDRGRVALRAVQGKPVIPQEFIQRLLIRDGQVAEYGQPDQLYLNDGRGRFSPVPWDSGHFLDLHGKPLGGPPLDWGLAAAFRDVNGDGAPDLYVCNDYWTPDRFWINDGSGRFKAIDPLAFRKFPSSSMGIDFADINRDGHFDFFVVDMLSSDPATRKRQMLAEKTVPPNIGINSDQPQVLQNTLFLNRGDLTFAEISYFAGLEASDWSWSPLFVDADLDGYDDLLISAGHFRDVQDMDAERLIRSLQHSWSGYPSEAARQEAYTKELMEHYRLYPLLQFPVRAFRNVGECRFQEVTADWGFQHTGIHHGMALGDLDGDGDLDLVVNGLNGAALCYRNNATNPRLALRLKGASPNTFGIGARLIFNDSRGLQMREMTAGGAYLSGSQPLVVFALPAQETNSLIIQWRSGKETTLINLAPNHLYEIAELDTGTSAPKLSKPATEPLFADVSHLLEHTHTESPFDDYARQPLLPFKLSQGGPGILWADLNGDGSEDLFVGSGAGGVPALFLSEENSFKQAAVDPALTRTGDYAGTIAFTSPEGKRSIMVAISGYEVPQKEPLLLLELKEDRLVKGPALPVPTNFLSATVLALGSFDRNGALALFVAGGYSPGRYPLGVPSAFFQYGPGGWRYDERNSSFLQFPGTVSAALWTDLTGDGLSELVLAFEWGPIRVFQNQNSMLIDVTAELGFAPHTGLWRSLAAADFNGDGRLDLVAGNWGLNSHWRTAPEKPLTLIYGEFFQPGRIDLLETEWDHQSGSLTPRRQLQTLLPSLPFFAERVSSFKQYSRSSLEILLGERQILSRKLAVTRLETTLFLNQGGKFSAHSLPFEAQLAPAYSLNPADLDGDGDLDLFIAQNHIAMHPEYARQDAGRGLLLQGDGKGGFRAMPGKESGIFIYGEQRGAALSDYNEDGRMDLVVSQNGAPTKLLVNRGGLPASRIQLIGPRLNRAAIGAVFWFESASGKGPAQEIHAGSGYLSQESFTKLLSVPSSGSVFVRWPGGAMSSVPVKPEDRVVRLVWPEE